MINRLNNSYNVDYIKEIDLLRGFAILGVLIIHTVAGGTTIRPLNLLAISNIFIDTFSHFAVPLFIFISGFVLPMKYQENYSLKLYYNNRIKSIIPQYIIFSILYTLFYAILYSPPTLIRFIKNILFATSFYHMWFFAILIQLYIFYPIIIKVYNNFNQKNKIILFLVLSLFIQIAWNTILGREIFNFISAILNTNPIKMSTDRIFFSYFFYFIIGIYLSQNYKTFKFNNIKLIYLLFVILSLTGVISYLWVGKAFIFNSSHLIGFFEPILYTSSFILFLKISKYLLGNNEKSFVKSVLYSLGNYSFGIYLIHVFFMTIVDMTLRSIGIQIGNIIFYPILFLTTIFISYYSVYYISYLPHSEIIVGKTNKSKNND